MSRGPRAPGEWRFWFILIAFLLAVGWVFDDARADDVVLTWENATENEDGTPLTNLAGIRIWQLVATTTDPEQTSYTISGLDVGDYTYAATSYTTDDPPVESVLSTTATKTVTEQRVTNIVVKIVTKIPGRFLLLGVGTVPLGTVCDTSTEVNGHYAVPFDDIVWSDPARNAGTAELPLIVVAECG